MTDEQELVIRLRDGLIMEAHGEHFDAEPFLNRCADAIERLAREREAAWRPISEHDGTMDEVLGMDDAGHIHSTWLFAPSSRTRDWFIVGCRNKKWKPTKFRALSPTTLKPE